MKYVEVDDPAPHYELRHALDLGALAGVRSKLSLRRHRYYRAHRAEFERVLGGFEWNCAPPRPRKPGKPVRAVAWNVERGKRFGPLMGVLQSHEALREADLLFLTELDIGMGRSQNRNVPRTLAEELGYAYAFANFHLVLAPGDVAEQTHGVPNTLAMHGACLLSRFPIRRIAAVALPEFRDKLKTLEARLGTKRALLCEVELEDGPLTVVVVHLDPFSSPRHRGRQMGRVIKALGRFGGERVLLGGDLNTNTYDLGSKTGLFLNIMHKLGRFGFAGTVAQYMAPEWIFERPTFKRLRRGGLRHEPFGDPDRGSINYDLTDPELVAKTLGYLPKPVYRWLDRRLRPWHGVVPMRIDWFAGRGVTPERPQTIERPMHEGQHVSDHNPILVDLRVG